MTAHGRMRWIEAEPSCIGPDTVVELLQTIGWGRAAHLIDDMSNEYAKGNREADRWRRAYDEIREKYEPSPVRSAPVSHQPPPEASD